jgi:hypothetical protein
MNGAPDRPATPALVGGAFKDADDSDPVVYRILVALTADEQHHSFTPCRTGTGASLPRRTPGQHPASYDPWRDRTQGPVRIVRDAASIAHHTSGYFRGWNRGLETARTGGSALAAAVTAPASPPLVLRPSARRRPALRPATALRLVGLVVRVLPTLDRPRYAEELRAEMAALTEWQQLAYAVRLALSAPALRRSLRQEQLGASNSAE